MEVVQLFCQCLNISSPRTENNPPDEYRNITILDSLIQRVSCVFVTPTCELPNRKGQALQHGIGETDVSDEPEPHGFNYSGAESYVCV